MASLSLEVDRDTVTADVQQAQSIFNQSCERISRSTVKFHSSSPGVTHVGERSSLMQRWRNRRK